MARDDDAKYWFNMKTGQVEHGLKSASVDRVGPFDTEVEASHALEKMRANSKKWAEDEAREDD